MKIDYATYQQIKKAVAGLIDIAEGEPGGTAGAAGRQARRIAVEDARAALARLDADAIDPALGDDGRR